MQESLAVAWVDVTVISGPSSLIGKSGQVPIHYNREEIGLELCAGQTHTWYYIGCDDFRLMFGEFEGIEKIAKAHVEIHLLYPFQVTNEFIVSGNTSQLRYWETPHTDVSFPNIKNSGTSVDVDVARVIIVRLSISDNAN